MGVREALTRGWLGTGAPVYGNSFPGRGSESSPTGRMGEKTGNMKDEIRGGTWRQVVGGLGASGRSRLHSELDGS